MEMDALFLILGPHHLFFLFVTLVLQNTSMPTPIAYPNPTRKYQISFLLASRHEASATFQTPKSKSNKDILNLIPTCSTSSFVNLY